jgi:hypothetical protein
MRATNIALAVVLGLSLIAALGPAAANTILAAGTPGEPSADVDARALGMGGAAIGIFDGLNVNAFNPAVPASYNRAVFNFTLYRGYNSYETAQGKSVEITYDLPRAELTVPLSQSLAATVAFREELNGNYELTRPLEDEGVPIGTSRLLGQGSVYSMSLGLAGRLGERWYAGGSAGYDFGAPKEIYSKDFKPKGYSRIEENLEAAYKGVKVTAGAGYMASAKLSLGAMAEFFGSHSVHETVFTEYATLREDDRRFTLPWSVGFGAAYAIGPRGSLAADVRYNRWSAFAVDGENLGYRNTFEVHAGAEGRLTTAKRSFFLWRMPYRAGVSYVPWYATTNGEFAKVGLSLGAGYLFTENEDSRLDFALEFSRRGDLASQGLGEEMIDFHLSVVGLETWLGKRERED